MFRFAIMGAGGIAPRFVDAVRNVDGCDVIAVSSKSIDRAKTFAEKNSIASFYDSYEKMLENEHPDCVYIATTPNYHYELTMLCLKYNTPVICEKAMFLSGKEAEEVFAISEKKNIFVMEALWSRFLPAVNQAKKWIEDGRIGTVRHIDSSIGFKPPYDVNNRYHNKTLGGGAAFDITCYAYEIASYMLNDIEACDIKATAVKEEETGIDLCDLVMLNYGTCTAAIAASFGASYNDHMTIYGDKGMIHVRAPHYTSSASLKTYDGVTEDYNDTVTTNGFIYEAAEAVKCIREGKYESSVVPHHVTQTCSNIFDMLMESMEK